LIARCRFDAADGTAVVRARGARGASGARGRRWLAAMVLAASVGTFVGCDDPARTGGAGAGGNGGRGSNTGTGGAGGHLDVCTAGTAADLGAAAHDSEGNQHITVCSTTTYHTVPPSSGPHYPNWPVYKTYAQPVPWGFLVHGLEHGAIVVTYNCPAGCADEVALAQAWIDGLTDPDCGDEPARVVLAPDPTLDVRWAASAWAWTLRACAFDAEMFQVFFTDHRNQGGELICRNPAYEVDWSAMGWCPSG
jgi:Protein of unknown function (DUF3105)